MSAGILDERGGELRQVLGGLLARSRLADLALTRVRLAALDLTPEEVAGPDRCRVLLGQLDAHTLLEAGPAGTAGTTVGATTAARLRDWLDSGRLLVRSAGIGAWTPDFSVFTPRSDGGRGPTALVGAHYFGSPHLTVGPSFTVVLEGPAATRLRDRFEEEWGRGHDVAPAIREVLAGPGSGGAAGP